jgi:peptidoglycan/LPS O-acetylase OafA/YrhL
MAALLRGPAVAIVISRILPHHFPLSRAAIAVMALFVANCTKLAPSLGILVGPLWSISIEEQFYLIWPPVIKFGGKRLAFIMSVVFAILTGVWLQVFSGKGWLLWYATPVEFLFFAAGAMIAIATRGNPLHGMNRILRGGVMTSGLSLLLLSAHFGYVGTDLVPGATNTRLYIKYAGGVAGCVVIFLAVLGMSKVCGSFIYLGKISYGLYVFHSGMLQISMWLTRPLGLASHSAANVFLVHGIALLLCILVANLSYRHFERLFMKLKERHAVILSRPA